MDAFQPKLVYLARRHPSLTRAQFINRWREHGRLGMSLPRWANIARYVHCDLQPPGEGMAGPTVDYDAIGLIWHKSPAHRAAHLSDVSSRIAMEADEARTFSGPIAEVCLLAREEIVRPPPPNALWKLTRFSQDATPAACPRTALGYVRDHPLWPENGRPWGLGYTLVEEFWFGSRGQAEAAAPGVGRTGLVVLGREVQLYP